MTGQQSPAETSFRASGGSRRWQAPGICLALAAMTFAVFGRTLRFEFVDFDDDLYVYDNPMVAKGLTSDGFSWAFTRVHSANWHPLTWLSHMLDCQLYGLHPGGHHLTNVLLHTATVIALFLVLREMTGAVWRSAFVAALFAIHPLRVESVAWVAERKDVLSGLFFVLTIGSYVRYARHPWSTVRYGLVLLSFALGLMCKPMLVTLPLILLLLDYWPLRRAEPAGRLILEKLPLLALSAAACAITLLAQGDAVHSGSSFSLPHRLGNAATSCAVYLGQMVWPARLAVLYPFPQNGQPTWEVALAAALIAGFSALAWWQRKMRPWLATGWVWYLVMLLPVAGLIQVGRQAHADRYTYLPQIGIYLALTWLVAEWRANRAAIGSLVAAALAVLMFCAWKQTAYWQDSETLWTHTLACTTDNDIAHNDLGLALFQKGRVDAAIVQYQEALKIRPDSAARNNLGLVLFQQGRVDEALLDFQEALKIKPDYAEARNNLGLALFQKGRVDEAMVNYEETLKIKPDYAEARNNLGNALLRKGKREEAITQFEMALRIKPSYGQAENNLGTTLHQLGRLGEAISHYQKAQELLPDNESVHFNFAKALLQQGRTGEAITQYQSALQIDPADVEAQNNLAWLLATSGPASLRDGNKAVQLARRANELAGGKDPVILGTLAAALAEAGQFDEARRSTQQAIALAQAAGQPELVRRLNSELLLYQTGRPFHQP